MEVFKHPKSPYWYFDAAINGKRVRMTTKVRHDTAKTKAAERASQREAERAAEAAVERLQADKALGASIPLGDAVDRYTAFLGAHGKASLRNVEVLRDKLLGRGRWAAGFHLDALKPIHDLKPLDMDNLVHARLKEGNGPQTIAHEIKMVRAAVRHAAGLGFRHPEIMTNGVVKNPWRMPALPQKTRYLSLEEWKAVFDYLDPDRPIVTGRGGKAIKPYALVGRAREERQDAQDLFVALTMTGGRWSEVAALTWDRVDTRGLAQWVLWETKAPGCPLDRPLVVVRVYGTKDDEERLAGAPDQVCRVLARRYVNRAKGEALIFPSPKRTGKPRVACRAITKAFNACGLNREDLVERYGRATAHSLRHTFASWLLQAGADLAEVQDALGHASPAMTRRYAHLAKRKTAEKIGGILSEIGRNAA